MTVSVCIVQQYKKKESESICLILQALHNDIPDTKTSEDIVFFVFQI